MTALTVVLGWVGVAGSAAAAAAAPAATAAIALAAPPVEPDATYLRAARQSNFAIIAAARDAQINGRASCVRRLGAALERDHRKLDAQAVPIAEQQEVTLPTQSSATQRRELDAVEARAGTSGYDAAWLALQNTEHRRALALIDAERRNGALPAAKAIASAARPVVEMHRDMIRGGTCRPASSSLSVATGDGGQMADAWRLRRVAGVSLVAAGLLLLGWHVVSVLRRRISNVTG